MFGKIRLGRDEECGRLSSEATEIANEMALVIIAGIHGDIGPIGLGIESKQCLLETRKPRKHLWTKPDLFEEQALYLPEGHVAFCRELRDRILPLRFLDLQQRVFDH